MNDMFPTPNLSLPFCVQTIEIDSCKQVNRLENIRYRRVIPDDIYKTTMNAVPLVYDRLQAPALSYVTKIRIQKYIW